MHKHKYDTVVPGAAPGTLVVPQGSDLAEVRVFSFDGETLVETEVNRLEELAQFLQANGERTTWIDVDGIGSEQELKSLQKLLVLHPLALEDTVSTDQRAKIDRYPEHDYLLLKMAALHDEDLVIEQLNIFVNERIVLTIQEGIPGDALEPVRRRLQLRNSPLRKSGTRYLTYALVDSVVDHYFPVIDRLSEQLQTLEEEALEARNPQTPVRLMKAKGQLRALRRALRPFQEVLSAMQPSGRVPQPPTLQPFLKDCQDHASELLDSLDEFREQTTSLMDIYLSRTSNRMNEVMRTLTVIATVFMPLTFIAGIYGMNFDTRLSPYNMPELKWAFGYPFVLLVMALVGAVMVLLFVRRGWFSQD